MALMNRVLQALRNTMETPNPTNLDVWVHCSCQHMPLNGANVPVDIPHIPLDLTREKRCLALSARGEQYLQQLRSEAIAIAERSNIYVPQILYACPFHNALHNIKIPFAAPAAED